MHFVYSVGASGFKGKKEVRYIHFLCPTKVLLQQENRPYTEAPLSRSGTKILHLDSGFLKPRPLRNAAVCQSQEEGQREITPELPRQKEKRDISSDGCSRWKSGKVIRGSKTKQQVVAAEQGQLWTRKVEILGLHRIMNYISLSTSVLVQRLGFNIGKGFQKMMETTDEE